VGEVVGGGLLSHVPTIMLPADERRAINDGREISLVTGLERLRREVFDVLEYDAVVVLDSHWATTVEFVITSHAQRAGLYTSDELPRGMSRIPYDFPGDPDLARAAAAHARKRGTWITAVDDPYLPMHYATLNLWRYLGVPEVPWLSMGVCQTADTEDYLRAGRALGDAIAELDRDVLLIASGALSHTFWPLREIRDHEASDPSHVFTAGARDADLDRIDWLRTGDHARVLDTMDDFHRFKPEARFGHYLMMIGAMGERECAAPGRLYSEYENAVGTGQVHIWFERPELGWR
jgi:3,4-dihydroxyphenylacetate 2,3-dioxygenase